MFFLEFNQIGDTEAKLTLITSALLLFLLFLFADSVLADHDTSGHKISSRATCEGEYFWAVSENPEHT